MKKKYIIFDDTDKKNKKNIDYISQNEISQNEISNYQLNTNLSFSTHNNNINNSNNLLLKNNNMIHDDFINSNKCTEKKIKKNKSNISNINIIDNIFTIPNILTPVNNNILDNNNLDNNNLNNKILDINDLKDCDKNNNNIFLKELIKKQLKNISNDKKLTFNDIKRISKFLTSSIFDKNKCSLWNGYITNENNQSKGTYINFYFNKKKIALHRLLYINYIEDVNNNEYIKFSCLNKGKCCNIYHMNKYIYNKNINNNIDNIQNNNNNNNTNDDCKPSNEQISINTEKNNLIVEL